MCLCASIPQKLRAVLIGLLPLRTLLVSDPSTSVREMMDTDVEPIPVDMADTEVARKFERNDWVSAPVVDEDGKLLGRITIDDVVDVIREGADRSLMSMAGLDEDADTFAPVMRAAPRRAPVAAGVDPVEPVPFSAKGRGRQRNAPARALYLSPVRFHAGLPGPSQGVVKGAQVVDSGLQAGQ